MSKFIIKLTYYYLLSVTYRAQNTSGSWNHELILQLTRMESQQVMKTVWAKLVNLQTNKRRKESTPYKSQAQKTTNNSKRESKLRFGGLPILNFILAITRVSNETRGQPSRLICCTSTNEMVQPGACQLLPSPEACDILDQPLRVSLPSIAHSNIANRWH